jgi:hypothetical protein
MKRFSYPSLRPGLSLIALLALAAQAPAQPANTPAPAAVPTAPNPVPAAAKGSIAPLTAQDLAEIYALYAKYPVLLDAGDAEGYADLFTEDGSFGNNRNREGLLTFVRGRQRSTVYHVPMTPLVTASPEGANGTVMNFFIDLGANPPAITRVSRYTDTLVKTPNGWRFKTRVNGAALPAGQAAPAARGGNPPAAPAAPTTPATK